MSNNSKKKRHSWINIDRFKNMKPEISDINYNYIDAISFNIIDNLTKYKNKELTDSDLTTRLLSNLSIILTKEKQLTKILSSKENDQNLETSLIQKNYLNKYEIIIPTSRITCLQKITTINKNNIKTFLQVPVNKKNIQPFLSSGRNFKDTNTTTVNKCNSISPIDNQSTFNGSSEDLIFQKSSNKSLRMTNKSNKNEDSDDDYSFSLVDQSFNKDNFEEVISSNFNKNNIPTFENYKGLNEYIECPLLNRESFNKKYNNFVDIFNNIENIIDSYDDNFSDKEAIDDNISKINTETEDNNFNQVIMDDYYINNYYTIFFYNSKNSNSTSNSNYYPPPKSNKKNGINKSNTINKDKNNDILSKKMKTKYLDIMNEQYILLLYKKYMKMISRCDKAKSYFIDDVMVKKLFLQLFKKFLLEIGISAKKNYEKILKTQIFNNKPLSFEQFIQSFDLILNYEDNIGYKVKYIFLFNLLPHESVDDLLNKKKVSIYFDLISGGSVFIQEFYEILYDRLILRYSAIYNKDEESNISEGKFRFRKLRIILESFFDELKIDD